MRDRVEPIDEYGTHGLTGETPEPLEQVAREQAPDPVTPDVDRAGPEAPEPPEPAAREQPVGPDGYEWAPEYRPDQPVPLDRDDRPGVQGPEPLEAVAREAPEAPDFTIREPDGRVAPAVDPIAPADREMAPPVDPVPAAEREGAPPGPAAERYDAEYGPPPEPPAVEFRESRPFVDPGRFSFLDEPVTRQSWYW